MIVQRTNYYANGTHPESGMMTVTNPVTEEIIGMVENMSTETVKETAARARAAYQMWNARGLHNRLALLGTFRDLLWQNQSTMIDIIRQETGKTSGGAFAEVAGIDITITWLMHNAPRVLRPEPRAALFPFLQSAKVYKKPYGVAGFISPWNYPLLLSVIDAIAALAAGNTVIIKPSEVTPFTTLYAMDLMHTAGIPRDVVQVVTGDGKTGAALVDNVDVLCFTGSTESGRRVAVHAAQRLIPYSLELGGKNAMLVLKDADLDIAASSLLAGALDATGQMCVSIERVYIEREVYAAFCDTLTTYAETLVIGSGAGFDVHVGSLTNARELERSERIVADALDKGARLLYGGKRRPDLGPLFYEPAILADCTDDMAVMHEEVFGPVIGLQAVDSVDEALARTNASEYGLSGAVYTRDLRKGEHIALQIDAGDVVVNRGSAATIAAGTLPWGGMKQSGIGRRGGPEGLLRFVQPQSVVIDRRWERSNAVTLVDPLTVFGVKAMRLIRRYVPFI